MAASRQHWTSNAIMVGDAAPRILSVPMITAALSDRRKPPARGTVFRWIRGQVSVGALRPLTRGLYVNCLARPLPSVAEAAGWIRSGAIVSLQTVLGESSVTNKNPEIVTCVIPIRAGIAASSRPVRTGDAEFRFHAMPDRLLNDEAGSVDDRLDGDVLYARATPEKALLDRIYLGVSPHTRLAGPPLDIDLRRLDMKRLSRLAVAMKMARELKDYLVRHERADSTSGCEAGA